MSETNPSLNDELLWYKDAIIYELHIKAFCDSNGDGIGDFEGLLQKLDYLENLGVTAVWVLPFYPSPLRDDGYDIADYYSINPSYGNVTQFQRFLEEAHRRDLKVITELVINHTSDQHPWFQRARRAPKGSRERNYYVWTDDPNQYRDVRIIFQDFEASNWTWDAVAQQYYWHRFFHHQPDLNYDSPDVQQEIFGIIDYWCKMGVDGFRLDAVPYLYEREGTNGENLPETHEYLKRLRKHVDENFPATVFLAEANMWPEDSASYFGNGDECHMNYHFPVMPRMFMALRMEDRYPITDIFDQTPEIPENCQWAIFLRNHDELTLEMVTDEERDYMYKTYAKDPKAKINLGIRHRLAPLMENSRRKIELLNCLLFSLRGTPVIYYGDEIGMGDNFYLGDRDGVRTPMQWSPDRNGGFSQSNPQKLYLPLILDPEYHYESINVETQLRNPSSLLWFMKRMITMRKKYKAFSRGDMKFINVENPKVLAFTRTYEEETILVVVNLSRYSQPAELDLTEYKGFIPVEVFSKNKFPPVSDAHPYFFTLDYYACQWFVLKKTQTASAVNEQLPLILADRWEDLVESDVLEEFGNTILPDYLQRTPWFIGKNRSISTVSIINHASITGAQNGAYLLLAEVGFESGLPELYQLPVIMIGEDAAANILESCPQAAICRIKTKEREGLLCDAIFTRTTQQAVLKRLSEGSSISLPQGGIYFTGSEELRHFLSEHSEPRSRVVSTIPNYTAIAYDNRYFLKIFRQVDRLAHPDVEMANFLRAKEFEGVPKVAGTIEWKLGKETIVIGMLQELMEYHGNGVTYMNERLNNFNEKILARNTETLPPLEMREVFMEPIAFDDLSEQLQEFLGGPLAERVALLGKRTGDLHKALASGFDMREFAPENFSLHYQRSLFSGMQSLVRSTFNNLARKNKNLPEDLQNAAGEMLGMRSEILNRLKRIYSKKFDVTKIRIHGCYRLEQVLFTGKDISIPYFGGDPYRSFSERRLKRSPLRDVANMICSFYYVAEEGLRNPQVSKEEVPRLLPYYHLWIHYVTGLFMNAYLSEVGDSSFIPKNREDLNTLLNTYLLEIAVHSLNEELDNRPDWVAVPMRIIRSILK